MTALHSTRYALIGYLTTAGAGATREGFLTLRPDAGRDLDQLIARFPSALKRLAARRPTLWERLTGGAL